MSETMTLSERLRAATCAGAVYPLMCEAADEIDRLFAEQQGMADWCQIGRGAQSTIDSLRGVQATILKWCEANIEDGTQVTDFCVQVRDLIEKNTTAYWAYQNALAQSNDTPDAEGGVGPARKGSLLEPARPRTRDHRHTAAAASGGRGMKFRKKPVVIEAMQLPPEDDDPSDELTEFLHAMPNPWHSERDGSIAIQTLEGVMRADPGDWIIRGVKGEYYPCKPDIFAATYEPVEGEG